MTTAAAMNQDDKIPTPEEEQAAFEAAYNDEDSGSSAVVDAPAVIDAPNSGKTDDPLADDAGKAVDAPAAAAAPAKAAEPDRFDAMEKRMQTWMREMGGTIGGMKDQMNRMSNAARATANAQGAAAPTKEQIEAATKSGEKWDALKGQFPEWGEAIDGQFSLFEQRIMSKIPQVDANSIRNDAVKASSEAAQLSTQELKQALPLYVKHPEWETTINTPEFMDWVLTDGPTKEEYAAYKQLEKTDPAKAGAAVNELIRKHPNWWSDKGSKLFEGSIKDSISLLDSYSEAAKAAANPEPADKGRQSRTARLEDAVTPTQGATRGKQVKSDQQEFEEAYYSS